MFGVVGQLLFGWLLADFLSGVFHWWEDRVGSTTMPLIGPAIVVPNREHHKNPIPGGSRWHNRLVVAAVATPLAIGLGVVFGLNWILAGMVLGAVFVNDVHCWAHEPTKAPRAVQMLQEAGLFQSPQQHAQHHRGAHDRRYCILTDMLNPWLDAVAFWLALEKGLTRIGLEPNRGTQ